MLSSCCASPRHRFLPIDETPTELIRIDKAVNDAMTSPYPAVQR